MARQINRLNARKLALTPGVHSDGGGLYLRVSKSGARSWVMIYNFQKKRREMGLGPFPLVSLADARARAKEQQHLLEAGVDPLAAKKGDSSETFGTVATALISSLRPSWKNPKHADQWTNTLHAHAAPLWKKPIDTIDTDDVLHVLNPIWANMPETASRVRGRIERVLDAAKVRGLRSGDNPARWRGHLEIILPKRKAGGQAHHPAMPYQDVPAFIADLRLRPALSARSLEFLILTSARTSEVTRATWAEFDLQSRLWTIPAERMKAGKIHRVPLSDRAIAIVEHVRFLGKDQPFKMSNMSMDMLLRRMGQDDYTVHGFRSAFRDWVGEETEFPREIAEAALAHQVGSEVERAYRRGDALEKRRDLMKAWEAYATNLSSMN